MKKQETEQLKVQDTEIKKIITQISHQAQPLQKAYDFISQDETLINEKDASDVMYYNFFTYNKEYLKNRTLPWIQDGLKPIHRRIVYDMTIFDKVNAWTKSATIVGSIMGNFHPHSNDSIYESMVWDAQPWNNPYPLIEMHGNMGSIDGSDSGAMRYVEAKPSAYAFALSELLPLIDKEELWKKTEMQKLDEPVFLPTLIPNLLVNANYGIALYPALFLPYNFNEVVELCIKFANGKNIDNEKIYWDFGNANGLFKSPMMIYCDDENIKNIMQNGEGNLTLYAPIVNAVNGLDILNIPWLTNTTSLVQSLIDTTDNTNKNYVAEFEKAFEKVNDETTQKDGFKVNIVLNKQADKDKIRRMLYEKIKQLAKPMHIFQNTIFHNQVATLGTIDLIKQCVINGKQYIIWVYEKEIKDNENELDLVNGMIKLSEMWDEISKWINKIPNRANGVEKLIKLGFNSHQAEYIIDLRLHRLSQNDLKTNKETKKKLEENIKSKKAIIKDDKLLTADYVARMKNYMKQFGRARFDVVLKEDLLSGDVKKNSVFKELDNNKFYLAKNGELSNEKTRGSFEIKANKKYIVISEKLMYYNYDTNNNHLDLKHIFKDDNLKIIACFEYNDDKNIVVATNDKIKMLKMSELANRIKPDELISTNNKMMILFDIKESEVENKIIGVKENNEYLFFNLSEVPYQVKGIGVALAKTKISEIKVFNLKDISSSLIRHRGYVLLKSKQKINW